MRRLPILVTLWGLGLSGPSPLDAQRVRCELAGQADGSFQGDCRGFDEGRGTLQLTPDEPVVGGNAPMAVPVDVTWDGVLQIPGWPRLRVEVESLPYEPDPAPVLKTQVAWVLVEEALIDGVDLSFWFQFDEDAPPTHDDLAIIERTAGILSDELVWDRSRGRRCASSARTWTLYCALRQATVEETGEFHDRQPAIVITSKVIGDVFRDMSWEDPLVEYNAYDDAILIEMHRLLTMASTRVRRDL
jgi:hypothetical protein